MTRDADQPAALPVKKEETFLQRWSRRKGAAVPDVGADATPPAIEPRVAQPTSHIEDCEPSNEDMPAGEHTESAQPSPLPPVESLTFESDFRAFLQPHVAEDLKRQALKKLLHDPRFNVMDGLDVYIDDYSIPSPLEPAVARALVSARYIFEPPPMRVNVQGHVEEVPPAESDTPGEDQGGEGPEVENETVETLDTTENRATAPEITPPDELRDEGEAPR